MDYKTFDGFMFVSSDAKVAAAAIVEHTRGIMRGIAAEALSKRSDVYALYCYALKTCKGYAHVLNADSKAYRSLGAFIVGETGHKRDSSEFRTVENRVTYYAGRGAAMVEARNAASAEGREEGAEEDTKGKGKKTAQEKFSAAIAAAIKSLPDAMKSDAVIVRATMAPLVALYDKTAKEQEAKEQADALAKEQADALAREQAAKEQEQADALAVTREQARISAEQEQEQGAATLAAA